MSNLEMISCKCCDQPMPKLRLTLYGYDFCVKCSTVKPKVGRTITLGQGDHTWNDLEILDQDTAKKVIELERTFTNSSRTGDLDLLDFNQEESYDETVSEVKQVLETQEREFNPDKPIFEDEEDVVEDEDLESEDEDGLIDFEDE